jgi:hypothetical protein
MRQLDADIGRMKPSLAEHHGLARPGGPHRRHCCIWRSSPSPSSTRAPKRGLRHSGLSALSACCSSLGRKRLHFVTRRRRSSPRCNSASSTRPAPPETSSGAQGGRLQTRAVRPEPRADRPAHPGSHATGDEEPKDSRRQPGRPHFGPAIRPGRQGDPRQQDRYPQPPRPGSTRGQLPKPMHLCCQHPSSTSQSPWPPSPTPARGAAGADGQPTRRWRPAGRRRGWRGWG